MKGTHLRGGAARLLLVVALLMPLVLATAFIVVHRAEDVHGEAVEPPARALSDDETLNQVLDTAREFVDAGRLRRVTGSYRLVPCRREEGPPYQGSVWLNFDLPSIAETPAFFGSMITVLTRRGWVEGLRPNGHPGGKTLGRNGISVMLYRSPDADSRGILQIYGQCSNLTDHREDATAFVDVTRRLGD